MPRGFEEHPVWSNDAKWIFVTDFDPYGGRAEIRRIAVADGSDTVLARSDEDVFDTLAVPPAGDELAYSAGPQPPGELRILDLRTMKHRRIATPGAEWFSGVAWSPDGKRLAYSIAPDGDQEFRNDLYVADADGSNPKLISPPGQPVGGWAWRPQG